MKKFFFLNTFKDKYMIDIKITAFRVISIKLNE